MKLDEFLFQMRAWGWAVTGAPHERSARLNLRDANLCALVERSCAGLDGWWDKDVAQLWTISVDRDLGTTRPPFWYALAGLAWVDRAWWLDGATP